MSSGFCEKSLVPDSEMHHPVLATHAECADADGCDKLQTVEGVNVAEVNAGEVLADKGEEEKQDASNEIVQEVAAPCANGTSLETTTPNKRPFEPLEVSPDKMPVPEWNRRLRHKTTVKLVVTEAIQQELQKQEEWFGAAEQGNPLRKNFGYEPCPECQICGARKHSAKWIYRVGGKGRTVTGGTCYSCWRATCLLGVSRSVHILKASPAALRLVQLASREVRNELKAQGLDVCTCHLHKASV